MSQSNRNTIDLGDYLNPAAKIFTGRPFGRKIREETRLDTIEEREDQVYIVLPKGLKTIGPSFFEELFQTAIKKLGKDAFLVKFTFVNESSFDYQTPLNEAIDRVLRKTTALG